MSLVAPAADLQLKSILVATDFSEASEKALRHTLAIARHYGAKFHPVHVVSSLGFTLVGPDAVSAAAEAVWRDARKLELLLFDLGNIEGRARPLQEGVDRSNAIVAGGRLQTRLPHPNSELTEFNF